MNINPISFGKTMKVLGHPSIAQTAANIMNAPYDCEEKDYYAQDRLLRIFNDITAIGEAQVVSFNDKCAYILTGKESEALAELEIEKRKQIEHAQNAYGEESVMVDLVAESEEDRYIDLAKDLIAETNEGTLRIKTNSRGNRIQKIDIVG